ncbi:SWIRM domain-containing protein [Pilobolus umbonatus]|nr:SWIRM domain-containing protein [Pilobolus umbonatus]
MARQFMPIQQHEIIIPSYSAWFDITSIHPLETRSLPEFFNNKNKSKNPSVYKEYRDFMVNTYRSNPLEYLTVTACRRNLTGDVCAIIRVHAFLEHWGLINYQIDPSAKPTAIGPPFAGQMKVVAELPRRFYSGTETNEPVSTSRVDQPVQSDVHVDTPLVVKEEKSVLPIDINLDLRTHIYDVATKTHDNKKSSRECSQCKKEYQAQDGYIYEKTAVCASCYDSDTLPEGVKKDDLVREVMENEEWTKQESLLLLEGLEMYPKDWTKIAEHVQTKSRDACILHYLNLPTCDPRIDPDVRALGLLNHAQQENVSNPIMSVVAFLAANVEPKVAAAILQDESHDEDVSMTEREEADKQELLEMRYELIRAKIAQFNSRMDDYEEIEKCISTERRNIEHERFLIRDDQLALHKKIDSMYIAMFQYRQAKLVAEKQKAAETTVTENAVENRVTENTVVEHTVAEHTMTDEQEEVEIVAETPEDSVAKIQEGDRVVEQEMPGDVPVQLMTDSMTEEEKLIQLQLKSRYPRQYLQKQQELQTQHANKLNGN